MHFIKKVFPSPLTQLYIYIYFFFFYNGANLLLMQGVKIERGRGRRHNRHAPTDKHNNAIRISLNTIIDKKKLK